MSNRPARSKAISGLPVTGVTVMMSGIIIGSQAPGSRRRQSVCFGRRHGGAGTMAFMPLTKVTGGRLSVSMEESITATATTETATGEADGKETRFVITPL